MIINKKYRSLLLTIFLLFSYPLNVSALKLAPRGSEIYPAIKIKNNNIKFHAGERGKIIVVTKGNNTPTEVIFEEFENENFKLNKDGTWESFGKFNFNLPVTYILSEKSVHQYEKEFPEYIISNKEQNETLAIEITYKNIVQNFLFELSLALKRDLAYIAKIFTLRN